MPVLNVAQIKAISKPGKYADMGGLYLEVSSTLRKTWIFRYMIAGRRREMGLGSLDVVSLSQARARILEVRKILSDGLDPIEVRETERRQVASRGVTLAECVSQYVESKRHAWTCAKQAPDWIASFKNHAAPLMELPVSEIDRDGVLRVLRAVWYAKPETGKRVRNRLERVLGYAKVMGYRTGENPAQWRDNLDHVLPTRASVAPVVNFPSMNRNELPSFMKALAHQQGAAYRALEFLIFTAARTNEVLKARWADIDFEAAVWTVPWEGMKKKRTHRVPLSRQALEVLRTQRTFVESEWVFPGRICGRPLSNMALLMVMRRMGRFEVSHGFRSTFKDWAAECTEFGDELSEKALAHQVKDQTKAAYQRGDMLEKRKAMMQAWADYCRPRETSLRVV